MLYRVFITIAVLLSALANVNTVSAGKYEPTRSGFYIGFGAGAGLANWDWVEFGQSSDEWSGVGNFRLGGALKDDVILGFEVQGWAKTWLIETTGGTDLGDATIRMGSYLATVTWFPGNVGAYARLGLGVARASVELTGTTGPIAVTATTSQNGLGLLLAGGYEWRLTRRFALGPQVEFVSLGVNGGDDAPLDAATLIDFSAQFNWYW